MVRKQMGEMETQLGPGDKLLKIYVIIVRIFSYNFSILTTDLRCNY